MKRVMLTDGAARGLDEWYLGAHARGGAREATRILDRIEVVLQGLADGSLRGEVVPELRHLGRHAERQVVTDEGLRVVFRSSTERIVVILLAPMKQSFQALLERRLLDG